MRWLIRKIGGLSASQGELQDSVVEAEKLTVGADTKSDLVLIGDGIEAGHLSFSKGSNGTVVVKTLSSSARVTSQDGSTTKKVLLSEGEQFFLGDYSFELLKAPAGIDAALTITKSVQASSERKSYFPLVSMTLQDSGFSLRRWSWYIMVFALLAGLVIPLVWVFGPQDSLGSVPVLSSADELWSPGPLAKVHHVQGIADNCQVCHSVLFSPVKDVDCKSCHAVGVHIDLLPKQGGSETIAAQSFTEGRCATCHVEHKDPSIVIRQDEPMCTSCHTDIATHGAALPAKASGISKFEEHPEFKLSMLVREDKKWQATRVERGTKGLEEKSNLEFSHQLHMNPDGIDGPTGRAELSCQTCHVPEQDGLLMKPISMEAHCSRCHTLSFEPTDMDRQVPHADLSTVQQSLEEYYSRLYAVQNGPVRSTVDLERPAKRPGKPKPDFYSSMKEWADDKANNALAELVKNKACSTCHSLEKLEQGLRVTPVKLADSWYPKSRFDHSSHEVFECESCHQATDSKDSADILIPDIKNCRTCHAGASDTHDFLNKEIKTVSSCMSCHQYHQTKMDIPHE